MEQSCRIRFVRAASRHERIIQCDSLPLRFWPHLLGRVAERRTVTVGPRHMAASASIVIGDEMDVGERMPMMSRSILFTFPRANVGFDSLPEPSCFADLLLDQVVAAVTKGRDEYNLLPFFYERLGDVDAISFRHDVWHDLEDTTLTQDLRSFSEDIRQVRQRVGWAAKSSFIQQRRGWILDAADLYCTAVANLSRQLADASIASRALLEFRDSLAGYAASPAFNDLALEAKSLKVQLATLRYCINVKGLHVRVLRYEGEEDYSAEIDDVFKRFQQGAVKDYRFRYSDWPDMNHVESSIADRVARLFPDVFTALETFCDEHDAFLDPAIASFDRELQFYLAYLDFIEPLKAHGLAFCLPQVENHAKEVSANETFDLALAAKLVTLGAPIVPNDFRLNGLERIIVVSGPNQGGKTTFARAFGQLHYLASLGLPVAGSHAQLVLFDELFTHFGKEEDSSYQSGKLEDDLIRIRDVLLRATENSIIIMNEIFSSTTVRDALVLGTKVVDKIVELDSLCVMVTFVDELTSLGLSIVSMASTINPDNPVERTFKIVRRPADGLAYAIALAEKYGLTYGQLRERISS